jgi:hypothetical protein
MKIHNPSVTGSLVLSGSLTATGNITTLGTLVAQTLVVQDITSSRDFVTGSTKFGTLSTNTHQFTGSVGMTGSLTVTGDILPSADNVYALGASGTRFNNIYSANGVINTLFSSTIRAASNAILFGSNQTNFWGGFIGNSSTSPGNLILTYVTSSAGIVDNGYKLQIQQSGSVSGSLFVSGSSLFNGTATIVSASLNYQQNLAVATGSFQTILSVATGSFRSAFFDYVAFSGSVVRAGIIVSTWSGSNTEFYENFTEDLGGSTSLVNLRTVISSGNIVLQAGISGSAWAVRSLVRLL